jgi:UDP-glucose 4-epimerase
MLTRFAIPFALISRSRASFAASAYVGESVADPQKYYENNVGGSLALLRAMLEVGCRKLVFSSSCAIYGEPRDIPIAESTPQNPVNPYGASKPRSSASCDYQRARGFRHCLDISMQRCRS